MTHGTIGIFGYMNSWFFTVFCREMCHRGMVWVLFSKHPKMEMTPKKSKVSKPSCVSFLTFLLFSPLLSFFFSCCFCSSIAGTNIIIIINTHHHHHQPSIINHHKYIFCFHQHHGHHSRSIITISSFQRSQQISAFLLTTKHFRLCCSCLNRSCSFYPSAFKPSKHVSMFFHVNPRVYPSFFLKTTSILLLSSENSHLILWTSKPSIFKTPPKRHPKTRRPQGPRNSRSSLLYHTYAGFRLGTEAEG